MSRRAWIPLVAFALALVGAVMLSSIGGVRTQAGGSGITWEFSMYPPDPAVGEPFKLSIYPSGYNGYPLSSTLDVDQPDPPIVDVSHTFSFSWTLTPLQNGKVTVRSVDAFETWDCPPGVTPTLPPGCPNYYYAASPYFSIDIGAPLPDADGDGCPDWYEQQGAGGSELTGGRRDYLNPNDYFNPTHDGQNRIDDVLAVVDAYFIDAGNPAYNPDTDRTLVGPNAWNLGPPDGKQRIDDVVNIVKQYYHDCA
jgi:hypothetical protein